MSEPRRDETLLNWQSGQVQRLTDAALHELIAQEYPRTPRAHSAVSELRRREGAEAIGVAKSSARAAWWSVGIALVALAISIVALIAAIMS